MIVAGRRLEEAILVSLIILVVLVGDRLQLLALSEAYVFPSLDLLALQFIIRKLK